jgi:hypothetical protein
VSNATWTSMPGARQRNENAARSIGREILKLQRLFCTARGGISRATRQRAGLRAHSGFQASMQTSLTNMQAEEAPWLGLGLGSLAPFGPLHHCGSPSSCSIHKVTAPAKPRPLYHLNPFLLEPLPIHRAASNDSIDTAFNCIFRGESSC